MPENQDTIARSTDIMGEEAEVPMNEQIEKWRASVEVRRNELFGQDSQRSLRPKQGGVRIPTALVSNRNVINLEDIFERVMVGHPASETQRQRMDAIHGRFVRLGKMEL